MKIKRIISAVTATLFSVSAAAGSLTLNAGATGNDLNSTDVMLPEITVATDEEAIEAVKGDANGDGMLNVRDCAYIASMIVKNRVDEIPVSVEYNGDGNLNIRDAAAIAYFLSDTVVEEVDWSGAGSCISIGNYSCRPGETITVDLEVSCNNILESFDVDLYFDPELTINSVLPCGGAAVYSDISDGICSIAGYGGSPIADGTVAGIEIKVPEDAVAGTTYEIYVSSVNVFAPAGGEDVAANVATATGHIEIEKEWYEELLPAEPMHSVNEGGTIEFTPTYESDDEMQIDVVSADTQIAEVVDNVIYGITAGITEIQYLYENTVLATEQVIVKTSEQLEVAVNQQKYIFASANTNGIIWRSGDESIAVVENGIVRGVSEGVTNVTAVKALDGTVLYNGQITVVEKELTVPVLTTKAETTTTEATTQTSVSTTKTSNISLPTGDANVDGKINVRDAAFICKCLANGTTAELPASADFNGDGTVNVRDAAYLGVSIARVLSQETGGSKIERDNSSEASVSLGDVTCIAGDTVTVPVEVSCNDNFESGEFIVEWDVPCVNSEGSVAAGLMNGYESSSEYFAFVAFDSSAIKDGQLAEITLDIPEDAAPGKYEIYFTAVDVFAEYEGEDLADSVSVSGGTITILPAFTDYAEICEGESITIPDEIMNLYEISSNNSDIAVVDGNTIKAVLSGQTAINFKTIDGLDIEHTMTTTVVVTAPGEFELQKGDTKSLYIVVDGNDLQDDLMWISSDTSVATVTDGEVQAISSGKAVINAIDKNNGSYVYTGIVTVTGEDEPAVTTTDKSTETETTETTVTSTDVGSETSATEVTTSAVTTAISTTETEPSEGDANGDGKLNVRDAAAIASALAKGLADTLKDIADFNKDGKVNVRDAAAIASYLAKGGK